MFDVTSQAAPEVVDGFTAKDIAQLGSATLHEAAGRLGALPAAIHPMTPSPACAGQAVTVACPPADNLWLHRAVYECEPGSVLVADVCGAYEWGYWGEVLSCAAAERGIAGVVINGCVRDIMRLAEVGIPVFARGSAIRGTDKHPDGTGAINADLVVGDVVVHAGDWVIGDEDGLVVIPQDDLATVVAAGKSRTEKEAVLIEQLRNGKRTLDLYGLPSLDPAARSPRRGSEQPQ
jgi:4-hydroxy-4-methyl-2-oxoglutarate aldolase